MKFSDVNKYIHELLNNKDKINNDISTLKASSDTLKSNMLNNINKINDDISTLKSNMFMLSNFDGNNGTEQFGNAMNYLDSIGGGTIVINKTISGDIVINKSNIKVIFIGGHLTGTIKIAGTSTNTIKNIIIDNFSQYTDDNTKNAITIEYAYNVDIRNGYCYGGNSTIFIPCHNKFQHVRRVNIHDNRFEGANYNIYLDSDKTFGECGDVNISNNFLSARNTHILMKTVDGTNINANTMFFNDYTTKDTIKKRNIDIGWCSGLKVIDNSCFEPGLENIYIYNSRYIIVENNYCAWAGQRIPSAGIKIEGGSYFGNVIGNVSNNIIDSATQYGITLYNVKVANINSNVIFGTGNTKYYYGTTDLSTVEKKTIMSDSHCARIITIGNQTLGGEISMGGAANTTELNQ